jgi:hypothetical protein
MKRSMLLATLSLAVLALAVTAFSNSVTRLSADIPFNFYVGAERLSAGQYIFAIGPLVAHNASTTSVTVLRQDGTAVARVATMPGWDSSLGNDHLRFNRYGDKYFLASVEGAGYQANLMLTRTEKEARAENVNDRGILRLALK